MATDKARTWQWAVKLRDGYYTHPAWAETTARAWAMSFQDNYAHEDCATAVKVEVRELPSRRAVTR